MKGAVVKLFNIITIGGGGFLTIHGSWFSRVVGWEWIVGCAFLLTGLAVNGVLLVKWWITPRV